jgi:carbamoyltransferase
MVNHDCALPRPAVAQAWQEREKGGARRQVPHGLRGCGARAIVPPPADIAAIRSNSGHWTRVMEDRVLGLTDTNHDSSWCFYGDDVHHVEVERFSRVKHERLNPLLGLFEIEGEAASGLIRDCGAIALCEGNFAAPALKDVMRARAAGSPDRAALLARLEAALLAPQKHMALFPHNVSDQTAAGGYRAQIEAFLDHCLRPDVDVTVVGHHLAHAANAFYSSPHETALVATLDGGGKDFLSGDCLGPRTTTFGGVFACAGPEIRPLSWVTQASPGIAWAQITTEVLGMRFGEEGTVMAMAAYGDPERFAPLLSVEEPWRTPEARADADVAAAYRRWLTSARAAIATEQDRFDFAAALQARSEEWTRSFLAGAVTPDTRALCLAGGFFLNCQIVGKIQEWFPWLRDVFLPPAPYDGGLSTGAAQFHRHATRQAARTLGRNAPFPFATGRVYSKFEVLAACRSARQAPAPAHVADIVGRLGRGEIGGLFAGAAESGRRALGHRSIIADPRRPETRHRLNHEIKKRSAFRPFAPFVLAERAAEWFECPETFASPYMSHAVRIRPDRRDLIPAVCHADGTARVQTVHRDLTPGLHALMSAWADATGVPVLLNTSFNDNEPIVQTPDHALNCFARTPLDFLYFGDFDLVCARGAPLS